MNWQELDCNQIGLSLSSPKIYIIDHRYRAHLNKNYNEVYIYIYKRDHLKIYRKLFGKSIIHFFKNFFFPLYNFYIV